MAIFHLSSKPLSRSTGRSAVAAAAYRSGTLLVDERTGREHNYTFRSGVGYDELVLPEGADAGFWTRAQLWNAAELAEARKDARTAREWVLALPEELTAENRKVLAVGFARELAGRYGCAVDVVVHKPDKAGDQRNHHAHLLATTRAVVGQGMGDKVAIELSDAKRLSLGLGQGRQEIEAVRALWAGHANAALERQGAEARIDPRSLLAQREEALTAGDVIRAAVLDRMPEIKLGWRATELERQGVATERGGQLRAIREENGLRRKLAAEIERLAKTARQAVERVAQSAEEFEAWFEQGLKRMRQKSGYFPREASLSASVPASPPAPVPPQASQPDTAALARRLAAEKARETGQRRRAEELTAERAREQAERQAQQERMEDWAATLWASSAAGRAEREALAKRETDRSRSAQLGEELATVEANLAEWKKQRFRALIFDPVGYREAVQKAQDVYAAHRKQADATASQIDAVAVQKQAEWPGLLQRAAEDTKEIAVRLSPDQVMLLLRDAIPNDRETSREVFAQVERRTHTMAVLDGIVKLRNFDQEGFVGLLQQRHRPILEAMLAQLAQEQQRRLARLKQAELERGRPGWRKQQEHDFERD